MPVGKIKKVLVANRGEIAIRVMRAAAELGIGTVGIFSQEDRFSLHRSKADESYLVGRGRTPVHAYLDIEDVIRIAREANVDAVHPGYGFLSENPDFAEACDKAGLLFIGPTSEMMRVLGNKVAARNLAVSAGVPVMPATPPLPADEESVRRLAAEIGYPMMLKASWGGGGRGMRVVEHAGELPELVAAARREAQAAFGRDEVYLEKLVQRARHVEVQILGDRYGNVVHLYERDCTVQRRHQKVVERAPAVFLNDAQRAGICEAALAIGRGVSYRGAGTVEFLQDADTGKFYFIEVNPRIQVEHTVTECVTGIDIVKAQIRIAAGAAIGAPESGVPPQAEIRLNGHAMQCRVTSEDPENNFVPDYGHINAYRSPAGFGVRLDGGTAYGGAQITPYYDSLLVKVTTWAPTPEETIARMRRALGEFRVRGVVTNLRFLEGLIDHAQFGPADYTTTFIDRTPELLRFTTRHDRATRLLNYIGHVIVNGNPAVEGRPRPARLRVPEAPRAPAGEPPPGTRQWLEVLGPKGFSEWMRKTEKVFVTDTTCRDAHQSLLATRMRTHDMVAIAPVYARLLPHLFSLECWGGATFDVAMRFLNECPWQRLTAIRKHVPNILLQMLLRSANGVGYTNYPDNVVEYFVRQAAAGGIDLFRIFDCLNWTENMRVAMDAVLATNKLCEAAICYTGNLSDPSCTKYDLKYYVRLAKQLEAAGAHIIGIKDMAGLCRPAAAYTLVKTLREEIGLPLHFHTHDTSGIAAASVLAAVEAGCDAVDGAVDSMSGLTSQPNLGSIVEALRFGPRDSGVDPEAIRLVSRYFEEVRACYAAFESDIRAGGSDVYVHGMPGGQYTNLREQAHSLGIGDRWGEVARAYQVVNELFGDIIKVTPTSKVVGDMALMMVSTGVTKEDVLDPDTEVAFPESVVSFFHGDLGQPYGGFPQALQRKVLKDTPPLTCRPGEVLPPADLDALRAEAESRVGTEISDQQFASYLMYPKVFTEYMAQTREHGDLSVLPTSVFFYGLDPGMEVSMDLERGKTLVVRFTTTSDPHEDGTRTAFFELNGQPRPVKIVDHSLSPEQEAHRKAEPGNADHLGAPMPGMIATVAVKPGEVVAKGDVMVTIEAMKMEATVRTERDGRIAVVAVKPGMQVEAKDLLVAFGPD